MFLVFCAIDCVTECCAVRRHEAKHSEIPTEKSLFKLVSWFCGRDTVASARTKISQFAFKVSPHEARSG